jgi:hypothetical protein
MQNQLAQNIPEQSMDITTKLSGLQPDGSFILVDDEFEEYDIRGALNLNAIPEGNQKPDADPNPPS